MERGAIILEAVRKLYDAIVEPDGWESAWRLVITAVGGHETMIFLGQDLRTGSVEFAASCGLAPEVVAAFAPAFEAGRMAPWLNALRCNVALPSSAVMPDRDFVRSEFYNESVRATGGFYAVLAAPRYTPHHRGFTAICRPLGSDDYDSENVETLQVLVPHLATALRVRQHVCELDRRAWDAYAVLDRLDVGIVLIDAAQRPRFVNARAEAIAAKADGFCLSSHGTITAARSDETHALQRAIAAAATIASKVSQSDTTDTIVRSATSAMEATLHLSRPSLRPPLTAIVVPLSEETWGVPHSVALFLIEPDRPPEINSRALAETYGLAPREVEVAMLLAQGHDPAQIAGKLEIGLGTAREHLKRVLDKTETHRQANLVRLLLREFQKPVH
ncbi:helix-turn-helix transcriptional regulator [Mesorhizobium captivum]|uniref:helix-turn-helix transcriptional regulator n=1 Tax=Mesorhizobium captivum TaxID=3072319 RepID=UPI002A240A61|nr:helix-turn-helix transcriptional regulator [Mesorhizobium sp. VK23E]MDX8516319.1 helix-turn-helix transcriptional regulator [Mesorhizobium sp. VK23E]